MSSIYVTNESPCRLSMCRKHAIYTHYQVYVLSCVENSSVVKIYIIRPKPGPVVKNATPRTSG